jgi:hypothetical protein
MDKTRATHGGAAPKQGPVRDQVKSRAERDHVEAALDEALKETFPASDPVAIAITTAARPLPPE